jgi:hypothetical protein
MLPMYALDVDGETEHMLLDAHTCLQTHGYRHMLTGEFTTVILQVVIILLQSHLNTSARTAL